MAEEAVKAEAEEETQAARATDMAKDRMLDPVPNWK